MLRVKTHTNLRLKSRKIVRILPPPVTDEGRRSPNEAQSAECGMQMRNNEKLFFRKASILKYSVKAELIDAVH